MLEIAAIAFATFFTTIAPIDTVAIFTAMTVDYTPQYRRLMAFRATIISAVILIVFALAGEVLLKSLGISLSALKTAGGILLFMISIDMVFARTSGGTSTTEEETQEASTRSDISVFPLATPLIAGPGAMGSAILLMSQQSGNFTGQILVIGSIIAVLIITFLSLLLSGKIQKILGLTGIHVISRVMGVLLSALSVQFIFDGIKSSGLF